MALLKKNKQPSNAQSQSPATPKAGGPSLNPADEQAQEKYNRFVMAGVKAVTAAVDDLMPVLEQEGDPAQNLAQATLLIVPEIQQQAQVPMDALLQGAIEIMNNIAEFGKEADIIPTDEATMNRAAQVIIPQLLDQFGTGEDMAAFMAMAGSVSKQDAERIGAQQTEFANQGVEYGTNQG